MGTIGYARVSTAGQSAELQTRALREAGCDRIFTDHGVSGTRASRPELDKMLDHLRKSDELVIWKLDRGRKAGRRQVTPDDENVAKAKAYHAKGNSVAKIQKLVGVSRATVYRYLSIERDVTA